VAPIPVGVMQRVQSSPTRFLLRIGNEICFPTANDTPVSNSPGAFFFLPGKFRCIHQIQYSNPLVFHKNGNFLLLHEQNE